MEYRIDTRLPLELLERYFFVYTGPNPGSFLVGAVPRTMDRRGGPSERYYPLTVYEATSNLNIIDRMFCFSLFYFNDEGELVLFLTHPCWLNGSESQPVLDFFLTEVDGLAKHMNSKLIEAEFHSEILSEIAHPASTTPFSYDLSRMSVQESDLSLLQSHGFREECKILCYEQSLDEIEMKAREGGRTPNDYTVRSTTPDEFTMLREDSVGFPLRAYALSSTDPAVSYISPFTPGDTSVAYKRSGWLRRTRLAGFLRWSPNLLEPSIAYRLPVPLLFHYVFKNYTFKCGKILDWALSEENEDLYTSLLSHASHSMKMGGLERCQIAYVNDEQSQIKTFLGQYGFRRVHTIKLLQKRLR